MPPCRIGYVAKVFPRLSETFVINEIRELERQGVEVRTFSLHAPPTAVPHQLLAHLQAPVVCVEGVAQPSERDCKEAAAILAKLLLDPAERRDPDRFLPRKYVKLALQLAAVAGPPPLDRLHAHFASRAAHVAMLASRLLGLPYSFTAHAKDIYHKEVDRDVLRLKMRAADLVVTVSEFNRRALLAIGAGITALEAKIVRAYNGVDLSLFHPAAGTERAPGRILGVGRLVEKKGFTVLIQACRILQQRGVFFTCELIGSGPQEPLLREMIGEFGLDRVVFLRGGLPLEQIAAEMRTASLLALPCVVASDGNVDALPTVLLEAMGSGIPVVSSALSGVPEIIVDNETGYLVRPGDAVALADAMAAILQDPADAACLGKAGRERAERLFDLRANVARLRALLTAPSSASAASI